MTKSLLISQPSSRMVNVLNELAKYLVVKRVNKDVIEKLERGETVEAYLYCTKGKPYLSNYYVSLGGDYTLHNDYVEHQIGSKTIKSPYLLNGTIPVKVVIDGYEKIIPRSYSYLTDNGMENDVDYKISKEVIEQSCLTYMQFEEYGEDKHGELGYLYALHISKLEILDEVMKLGEFYNHNKSYEQCPFAMSLAEEYMTDEEILLNRGSKILTKVPQNMISVWVK